MNWKLVTKVAVGVLLASGLAWLAGCLMVPPAYSAEVTLGWDPPTNRMDGSALSPDEIGGYKIYVGPSTRAYTQQIDVGNVLRATVTGLQENVTNYMTGTCYLPSRLESDYCDELVYCYTNHPVPARCQGLAVVVRYAGATGFATVSWVPWQDPWIQRVYVALRPEGSQDMDIRQFSNSETSTVFTVSKNSGTYVFGCWAENDEHETSDLVGVDHNSAASGKPRSWGPR